MAPWKNRIVGYANVAVEDLKANPRNWRTHSKRQQDALSSVVREVGVVQNIIVNKRTGLIVDGHLRLSLALRDKQPTVPVTYVDLSESEESMIIATFDPISALAGTDTAMLDSLLRDIETADANIMDLLSSITTQNQMYALPTTPVSLDVPITYDDEQPRQPLDRSNNLLGDPLSTTYRDRDTPPDDDDEPNISAYSTQSEGYDTPAPVPRITPPAHAFEPIVKSEGEGGDDFDVAPVEAEEYRTKPGDLWLLGGRHRLFIGDSTNLTNLEHLFAGEKAGLVFTDPPWNVAYGTSDHPSWRQRTIANDNLGADFLPFLRKTFHGIQMFSTPGAAIYVVMSAQEWHTLHEALSTNGFHWSSTIIWAKDTFVMGRKDYHTKYEPIWYGWLDNAPRRHPLESRRESDVWEFTRPKRSDEHPTMKPVALVQYAIANSSFPNDIVYDAFLGSGTTLIAASKEGRICYGCELMPQYGDVILKRAEAEGLSTELLSNHASDAE
jgi:DNA modification methylase